MDYVTLGRTEIKVCKNGFGALPIQRISFDSAKEILLHAYNSGINFFDTARFYTDSEEKIGYALSDVRDKIYIATKTAAQNADDFWKDLNTSLNNMKTDYIDIYQFHNPSFCPKPNDGTGLYEAMLEAKAQGKIRFIGLTNHRLAVAQEAIDSGLYDTLQFQKYPTPSYALSTSLSCGNKYEPGITSGLFGVSAIQKSVSRVAVLSVATAIKFGLS